MFLVFLRLAILFFASCYGSACYCADQVNCIDLISENGCESSSDVSAGVLAAFELSAPIQNKDAKCSDSVDFTGYAAKQDVSSAGKCNTFGSEECGTVVRIWCKDNIDADKRRCISGGCLSFASMNGDVYSCKVGESLCVQWYDYGPFSYPSVGSINVTKISSGGEIIGVGYGAGMGTTIAIIAAYSIYKRLCLHLFQTSGNAYREF